MGHHWELTQETERLKAALAASQAALATMEGESNTTRVRLVESNARVIGRILRSNSVPSSSCLVVLLLMISSFVIIALTEELEALQLAMNNATGALNARGDLVVSRLHDIPVRAEEIALHGVRHGAAVALMTAQVNSRHELRGLQPGFADGGDHHELVEAFARYADAAANLSSAGDVVNVFFGS